MKCGQGIIVKDFWGSHAHRFIAQCEGRYLLISSPMDGRNGYLLNDWRAVLRELVALTVPRPLLEKTQTVEAAAPDDGLYLNFPLTYPLSVSSLARLFGVPPSEVAAELADLAVSHEV